jgi:hypothetical protein
VPELETEIELHGACYGSLPGLELVMAPVGGRRPVGSRREEEVSMDTINKLDWERVTCSDLECRMDHYRYFDAETEEVLGMVTGPLNFGGSFMAVYRGDEVGEYRTSTAAMEKLQQVHEQGGLEPKRGPATMAHAYAEAMKAAIPEIFKAAGYGGPGQPKIPFLQEVPCSQP